MSYQKTLIEHIIDSDKTGGANAARLVTTTSGDSLAQDVPLLYNANGDVISTATRTGSTTNFTTAITGSKTAGNYPKWDASGNLTDGDTGVGGGGAVDDPPQVGDFTWVNQGSASANNDHAYLEIVCPAESFSMKILKQSAPSTPWTKTVRVSMNDGSVDFHNVGLAFRESSSGRLHYCGIVRNSFLGAGRAWGDSSKTNSATSFNVRYNSIDLGGHAPFDSYYIQIGDNGTNRVCKVGLDLNQLVQFSAPGRTDWLTGGADEWCIYAVCDNTSRGVSGLFHHLE